MMRHVVGARGVLGFSRASNSIFRFGHSVRSIRNWQKKVDENKDGPIQNDNIRTLIENKNWDQLLNVIKNDGYQNLPIPNTATVWDALLVHALEKGLEVRDWEEYVQDLGRVLDISKMFGVFLRNTHTNIAKSVIGRQLSQPSIDKLSYCCDFIDMIDSGLQIKRFDIFYRLIAVKFCSAFKNENTCDLSLQMLATLKEEQILKVINSVEVCLSINEYIHILNYLAASNPHLELHNLANAIISSLSSSKRIDDADIFMEYMINHTDNRLKPNLSTLNAILTLCASLNLGTKALEILERFEDMGILREVDDMKSMYLLVALSQKTSDHRLVNIKKGFSAASKIDVPTNATFYTEMVRAITYTKDYDSIKKYFKKLRTMVNHIDPMIYDNCVIRANEMRDTEIPILTLNDMIEKKLKLPFFTTCTAICCLAVDHTILMKYFSILQNRGLANSSLIVVSYLQSLVLCIDNIPDVVKHAEDLVRWSLKNRACSADVVNSFLRICFVTRRLDKVFDTFDYYFVKKSIAVNPKTISVLGMIENFTKDNGIPDYNGNDLSAIALKMLIPNRN